MLPLIIVLLLPVVALSKEMFLTLYKDEGFGGTWVESTWSRAQGPSCYCIEMNGFKSAHWDLKSSVMLDGGLFVDLTFYENTNCEGKSARWPARTVGWDDQPDWFGNNLGETHRTMYSVSLTVANSSPDLGSIIGVVVNGNACKHLWAGGSMQYKSEGLIEGRL